MTPDFAELVQWAEAYGHPEDWAKRAQAAHARSERYLGLLLAIGERGALQVIGGTSEDMDAYDEARKLAGNKP